MSSDWPDLKGLGLSLAGLVWAIFLTIYLVLIGVICAWGIQTNWPDCPSETPLSPPDLVALKEARNDKKDGKKDAKSEKKKDENKDEAREEKKEATKSAEPVLIGLVEPEAGSVAGHECVTIHGSGFGDKDDLLVFFGGRPGEVLRQSRDLLIVASPPHGAGKVSVTIRRDGQLATKGGCFTYSCPGPRPKILLLMVLLAGAMGGCLHGMFSISWYLGIKEFDCSWIVYYLFRPFSGAFIALVFLLIIRAGFYTPQGAEKDLAVGIAAIVGIFSQNAVEKLKQIAEAILTKAPSVGEAKKTPTVEKLTIAGGKLTGDRDVEMVGTGLAAVTSVKFGEKEAVIKFRSDTKVIVTAPGAATAGKVPVVVSVGAEKLPVLEGYTYQDFTVDAIEPDSGPVAGGTSVTIKGKGFFGKVTSVKFGNQTVNPIPIIDVARQEIKVTAPAGSPGQVPVVIKLGDGQDNQAAPRNYTYTQNP